MRSPGPFFVGGTGRSGTTRLTTVLGQHPSVYALPGETRFLIDPGGLEDLARALTEAYTPYHGDDALRRFDRLMRETLTGRSLTAFRGWDLPSIVGAGRTAKVSSLTMSHFRLRCSNRGRGHAVRRDMAACHKRFVASVCDGKGPGTPESGM
jgi:hypothetical protein